MTRSGVEITWRGGGGTKGGMGHRSTNATHLSQSDVSPHYLIAVYAVVEGSQVHVLPCVQLGNGSSSSLSSSAAC